MIHQLSYFPVKYTVYRSKKRLMKTHKKKISRVYHMPTQQLTNIDTALLIRPWYFPAKWGKFSLVLFSLFHIVFMKVYVAHLPLITTLHYEANKRLNSPENVELSWYGLQLPPLPVWHLHWNCWLAVDSTGLLEMMDFVATRHSASAVQNASEFRQVTGSTHVQEPSLPMQLDARVW